MADEHEDHGRRKGRRAFLTGLGVTTAATAAGFRVGTERASASAPPPPDPYEHQLQIPHHGTHRIVWSIDTDRPQVALTFDDGPDPRLTPQVLEILDDFGITATFLMMGHNAVAHPEVARQVVEAGHEIGGHTATHLDLGKNPSDVARREIEVGTEEVEWVTGQKIRWFRPPRGQLSAWTIRYSALLGQDTVMWSLSRGEEGDADAVATHLAQMTPGDVILLHDGCGRGTFHPDEPFAEDLLRRRRVELEALPRVLSEAQARGLDLVTVSELVAGERTTAAS